MRYHDPKLRTILAGEYVIGILPSGARRRFEQLIARDPVLRSEVESWEDILSPLSESLPERPPPEHVWQSLSRRLEVIEEPPPRAIWDNLRFWRTGGLLAAACSLLLAVLLGVQLTREPEIRYVAVVSDSQQRSAWLVTATPRLSTLEIRTLAPQALARDKSFELWLLPGDDGSPRSLGLLGGHAEATQALPRLVVESLPSASGLAVSLEPRGGSPTGQPTGPVLYQGRILRL